MPLPADMAEARDMPPPADMAEARDMPPPADMAEARDMPPPADMAEARDMPLPADMAEARDMPHPAFVRGVRGAEPPVPCVQYKMRYHTEWRQFFFLTIAVTGRRHILSRIIENAKYPALLPAGEAVHRALRALHATWPEATLSNYVIMPDHVHFLLIIDPSRSITGTPPTPLYAAHRMMDEAERIHGAPIFERRCYMELSFDSEQLRTIRRYIQLNPARALWKSQNPDMFICRRGVKTALLRQIGGAWDAIGDITLLGSPFLMHIRLTMKKTALEHAEAINEIIKKAQNGAIAVSGFISPGEREALRRLKATPGARFIKVLPYPLPHRYDPSAEDSRELAAHRMLIISDVPLTADSTIGARRTACLAMNDRISEMCRVAASLQKRTGSKPLAPTGGGGDGGCGGLAPRALRALAAIALAAITVAFTPIADPDYLEPSIQNEVDHALSRGYAALEIKGKGEEVKGKREEVKGKGDEETGTLISTNATFIIDNPSLSATERAIRIVSAQKADGRWYDGTNDVTRLAIETLEKIMNYE